MVLYDFIEQVAGKTFRDTLFDDIISTNFTDGGNRIVMGVANQSKSTLVIDGLCTTVRQHNADTFQLSENLYFTEADVSFVDNATTLDITGKNSYPNNYSLSPARTSIFCPCDFTAGATVLGPLTVQDAVVGQTTVVQGSLVSSAGFVGQSIAFNANVKTDSMNVEAAVFNGPCQVQSLTLNNTSNDFNNQLVIHGDLVLQAGALLHSLPISTLQQSLFQKDLFVFGDTNVVQNAEFQGVAELRASGTFNTLKVMGRSTLRRGVRGAGAMVVVGDLSVLGPVVYMRDSAAVFGACTTGLNATVGNDLRAAGSVATTGVVSAGSVSVEGATGADTVSATGQLSAFAFTCTADANVAGALTVAQGTSMNVGRWLGASQASDVTAHSHAFSQDLYVGADLSTPSLVASGNLTCMGQLTLENPNNTGVPLSIAGASTVNAHASVLGDLVVLGGIVTSGALVAESAEFGSSMAIGGDLQVGTIVAGNLRAATSRWTGPARVDGLVGSRLMNLVGSLNNYGTAFAESSLTCLSLVANGGLVNVVDSKVTMDLHVVGDWEVKGTVVTDSIPVVSKRAFVAGAVTVNSNRNPTPQSLDVFGSMVVSAASTVGANKVVAGSETVGGTLSVLGGAVMQTNAVVSGSVSVDNMTVRAVRIEGGLTAGDSTVQGGVRCTGDGSGDGRLVVGENMTVGRSFFGLPYGHLDVEGRHTVNGTTALGSLTAGSWATLATTAHANGPTKVSQNVDIDHDLTVHGRSNIEKSFTITRPTTVKRGISCGSLVLVHDGLVLGSLQCASTGRLARIAQVPDGANVAGNLFVNPDPTVITPTGNLSIGGTLVESGIARFASDTTFAGSIYAHFRIFTFGSDLNVGHKLAAGKLTVVQTLAAGTGTAAGAVRCATLSVDGAAVVSGSVSAPSFTCAGGFNTTGPITAGTVSTQNLTTGFLKCLSSLTVSNGANFSAVVSTGSSSVAGNVYCADVASSGALAAGPSTTGSVAVLKNTAVTPGKQNVEGTTNISGMLTVNIAVQQLFKNIITNSTKTFTCLNTADFNGDVEVDVLDISASN